MTVPLSYFMEVLIMKLTEKRAYRLTWDEVGEIIADEMEKILGFRLACMACYGDDSYWDIQFPGYHMPLSQVCALLEATDAPKEAWEDALPDEGERTVTCLGLYLPLQLIKKNLSMTWKHTLITPEGLWLVGIEVLPDGDFQSLCKTLLQAVEDIRAYIAKWEAENDG